MINPPRRLLESIDKGLVTITRRLSFYEEDDTTRWFPGDDTKFDARLVDGSVSIDYDRDERRQFDLTLDDVDRALLPNPNGGLWYDKTLRLFRGYRYPADSSPPKIAIVEEGATVGSAYEIRNILYQQGYNDIKVLLNTTKYSDVSEYDILISYTKVNASNKAGLLLQAYNNGAHIITISRANTQAQVPLYSSTSTIINANSFGITPTLYDTPIRGGWAAESYVSGAGVGTRVTALRPGALAVATDLDGSTVHYTGVIEESASGGKWFSYQTAQVGPQGAILVGKAVNWMWNFEPFLEWETPLGRFLIDKITYGSFPHQVKLNGRDYTKRCLESKFKVDTSFVKGTDARDIVTSLAANCGIPHSKLDLNFDKAGGTEENWTIDQRMSYAKETPRWQVMKEISNQFGYELYFASNGSLTARPFLDPTESPVSYSFKTGESGTLMSISKGADDTRIKNVIVATGERNNKPPYHAVARNVNPDSPTNVDRLGERIAFITGSYFKSDEHCLRTAKARLRVSALESFEVPIESLVVPWMEVGEVIQILDPDAAEIDPNKYLLTSFTVPLLLGPMSSVGKRVTKIKTEDEYTSQDDLDDGGSNP